MERLLVIGFAGALGALSRYGVQSLMNEVTGRPSVTGTLLVNLTGSFVLGLLLGFAQERADLPEFWRYAGAAGFLGAYTTFSTLMFESVDRIEQGAVFFVFAYLAISLVAGLALAYGGLVAGRALA
jgi:CrcB protein